MTTSEPFRRPSRVSVPPHAHPLAKIVFQLMRDTGKSYDEVEWLSGLARSTLKSYRLEKRPGLQSIEALLGVWGYSLVAVPPLDTLKPDTREALDAISLDFISDNEALGAAILAAVAHPNVRASDSQAAPRIDHRSSEPYWRTGAA